MLNQPSNGVSSTTTRQRLDLSQAPHYAFACAPPLPKDRLSIQLPLFVILPTLYLTPLQPPAEPLSLCPLMSPLPWI